MEVTDWISAISTFSIFVLAIFQFREARSINKIQQSLSLIDLSPSIDLEYSFDDGTLFFKNTGRTQLFFHAASTHTHGTAAPDIEKDPQGKRLISVNSVFPLAFRIDLNRNSFVDNERKEVSLDGKAYISNIANKKYVANFTVKLFAGYEGGSHPVIYAQSAWIYNFEDLEKFPWEE
ncbi:hypothetical protein [Microbulbifer sp.]|uniref:hypothetical protein n=1 Tax=Microbulbifer sp. TaxID=1908541 RepID=UPI002589B531|nr:hypothetical protein [Microbulbifer sp.]